MAREKENYDSQILELKDVISSLKSDLKGLAEMVQDMAGANDDLPHHVIERMQDGLDRSRQWMRHATEQTKDQAQAGLKAAQKQVQKKPLATLATAIGLGFICGQLLSVRK